MSGYIWSFNSICKTKNRTKNGYSLRINSSLYINNVTDFGNNYNLLMKTTLLQLSVSAGNFKWNKTDTRAQNVKRDHQYWNIKKCVWSGKRAATNLFFFANSFTFSLLAFFAMRRASSRALPTPYKTTSRWLHSWVDISSWGIGKWVAYAMWLDGRRGNCCVVATDDDAGGIDAGVWGTMGVWAMPPGVRLRLLGVAAFPGVCAMPGVWAVPGVLLGVWGAPGVRAAPGVLGAPGVRAIPGVWAWTGVCACPGVGADSGWSVLDLIEAVKKKVFYCGKLGIKYRQTIP